MRAVLLGVLVVAMTVGGQAGAQAQVPKTAPLAQRAAPGMEVDTNRFGSDYRGFDAGNAQACQAACVSEAACRAWTWVKPGIQGPAGKCWLKNQVPPATASACCVSGLGRPPASAQVPAIKGSTTTAPLAPGAAPLVKLTPASDAQQILRMPDATVLEDAQGRRTTVGQVRGEVAAWQKQKAQARPGKTAPAQVRNPRQGAGFHSIRSGSAGLSSYLGAERAIASGIYRESIASGNKTAIVKPGSIELEPAIVTINQKHPTKFTFTPGVELAIRGRGFGKSGQMRLVGNFAGPVGFTINHWQDDLIYAKMDASIAGELDKDDVMLEVVPAGKRAIQAAGTHFYAARELSRLSSIPLRYVTLPGQRALYCMAGGGLMGGSAVACAAAGVPNGVFRSSDVEWFQPGSDYYRFDGLKPGFTTDSMQFTHGQTDSSSSVGCSTHGGSMGFKGQYAANWDGDNIRVDWGVWHCHSSPWIAFPFMPRDGYDMNQSFYTLGVWVSGPRGVSPWKQ